MIHWILFLLQILTIVICFVYSLKLVKKNVQPTYMRYFFLYPLFAFLSAVGALIALSSKDLFIIGEVLINFSSILHYVILGVFIFYIQNPKPLKYIQIFLLVAGLINVVYAFNISLVTKSSFITASAANGALIIFCIFYFGSILSNPNIGNLKKDPGFWIVAGVMIGMGAGLPILISMKQIAKSIGGENASYFRDSTFINYTIMYIGFIKAIKCTQAI